jgi:hypothetical protein
MLIKKKKKKKEKRRERNAHNTATRGEMNKKGKTRMIVWPESICSYQMAPPPVTSLKTAAAHLLTWTRPIDVAANCSAVA